MAIVHYRQGEEESASKILDGIRRARRFVPKIAFAYVALAREDYDGAFQFLNAAFEQREPSLRFLKVHPFFGTLASDHRFAVLLKKLGLGAC